MKFEDIVGAVARGWCDPKNQFKKLDADLVIAIAEEVQRLSAKPEVITEPAEIRRVFELDDATWPDPDSGFSKLGDL